MPIGPRIKRYKGTATTDGAGAATVDLTPGAGYKLHRVIFSNHGAAPLTGGTVVARDDSGGGSAVNDTWSTPQTTTTFDKNYPAVAIVTNLRLTAAGAGATKTFDYDVTFYRTQART